MNHKKTNMLLITKMWDRLNKDVQNIVCKYLHRYNNRIVIEQYNKDIKRFWCGLMSSFYSDDEYLDFRINYRRLHEYPDRYCDVHLFRTGEPINNVLLPQCYVYTGIWSPVYYELITHDYYNKTKKYQ